MKTYKGFDKNLKCRDFQYKIGKEYKEKKQKSVNADFMLVKIHLKYLAIIPRLIADIVK